MDIKDFLADLKAIMEKHNVAIEIGTQTFMGTTKTFLIFDKKGGDSYTKFYGNPVGEDSKVFEAKDINH